VALGIRVVGAFSESKAAAADASAAYIAVARLAEVYKVRAEGIRAQKLQPPALELAID